MIIENLDFGSSDILQYIPEVPAEEKTMPQDVMEPPTPQFKGNGQVENFPYVPNEVEKNPPQIEMDFSTPIADVVPSATFSQEDSPLQGPYKSPTTQRVTALSADNLTSGVSADKKNPFGLTDEQLQAAIAGLAAVIAFSKPVQDKLADLVPKFLSEAGNLTTTGMVVSALVAAVAYYIIFKLAKQ